MNECTKCDSSGRLYNGICYESGHSIDPSIIESATTTASNENFPNCLSAKDNVCTECDSTYELGGGQSSALCCGKQGSGNSYFYDKEELKCK